ncbi:MAG: hypothetical protein H6722_05250 [Sandaracinus sp.]|nr:hypothetical protein [Sandaracinus sp.]MCB9611846.1 hypothetical protein [Sandaracinus sp.]MCB9619617.1 hypothetical protein [Sandaracinus sp.]MCB9624541.1 hypothetical protein [Sandaracinus sp.]
MRGAWLGLLVYGCFASHERPLEDGGVPVSPRDGAAPVVDAGDGGVDAARPTEPLFPGLPPLDDPTPLPPPEPEPSDPGSWEPTPAPGEPGGSCCASTPHELETPDRFEWHAAWTGASWRVAIQDGTATERPRAILRVVSPEGGTTRARELDPFYVFEIAHAPGRLGVLGAPFDPTQAMAPPLVLLVFDDRLALREQHLVPFAPTFAAPYRLFADVRDGSWRVYAPDSVRRRLLVHVTSEGSERREIETDVWFATSFAESMVFATDEAFLAEIEPLRLAREVPARGTLAGLTHGRRRAIGYVLERGTLRVARFTGTDTLLGGLFRARVDRRLLDVAFEERRAVHVTCDLEGRSTQLGQLEAAAFNDEGALLGVVPLSSSGDACRVGVIEDGRYAVMWSDASETLEWPRSTALHTAVLTTR